MRVFACVSLAVSVWVVSDNLARAGGVGHMPSAGSGVQFHQGPIRSHWGSPGYRQGPAVTRQGYTGNRGYAAQWANRPGPYRQPQAYNRPYFATYRPHEQHYAVHDQYSEHNRYGDHRRDRDYERFSDRRYGDHYRMGERHYGAARNYDGNYSYSSSYADANSYQAGSDYEPAPVQYAPPPVAYQSSDIAVASSPSYGYILNVDANRQQYFAPSPAYRIVETYTRVITPVCVMP